MNGIPWSRHEIRVLTKAYSEGGTYLAAQQLPRRNAKAIKTKAVQLMLTAGVPDGYVEAKHVMAKKSGKFNRVSCHVLNKARADGVLRYEPNTWIKYTVPVEWAEQFTRDFNEDWDLYQQTRVWLTPGKLAKLLGYNQAYLNRAFLNNERIAREIYAHVETVRLKYPRSTLKFHPAQATTFAEGYVKHMTCPKCSHSKTKVIRTTAGGTVKKPDYRERKRRRYCPNCEHRFYTTEMATRELTQRLMGREQ